MPIKDFEEELKRRLVLYGYDIERMYDRAILECSKIGGSIVDFNPDKPFSFNDYPSTKNKINSIVNDLNSQVETVIVDGVKAEWENSNFAMDEKAKQYLQYQLSGEQFIKNEFYRKYFNNNEEALKAFQARKDYGLGLSDRVWRYSTQFKADIEMGIDLGLRDGLSAPEMARNLKQYLIEPDKLFRRVRDEHGVLHLSKRASAYHTGVGVYRSSYKNARRLAVTEINMAYRTAEHERIKQIDFIVGIEIKTSVNNHPIVDICDHLKGKYPKDFIFKGWHPHCRCHAITIMKTDEEFDNDNALIKAGKQPLSESVNSVKAPPAGMKKWLDDNAESIDKAQQKGTLPYFLKDNLATMKKQFKAEIKPAKIEPVKAVKPVTVSDKLQSITPDEIQGAHSIKALNGAFDMAQKVYDMSGDKDYLAVLNAILKQLDKKHEGSAYMSMYNKWNIVNELSVSEKEVFVQIMRREQLIEKRKFLEARRLNKEDIPTLKYIDQRVYEKMKEYSALHDERTIEALENGLKKILDDGEFSMRVDSSSLNSIMEYGFLNQGEVERVFGKAVSNGLNDLDMRKRTSSEMFGIDRNNTDWTQLERYGFLSDKRMARNFEEGVASGYGDVIVTFKKSEVNTTFTLGDSLGSRLIPSLTSNPKLTSTYKSNIKDLVGELNTYDGNVAEFSSNYQYVELQFHGDLNFKMVEKITMETADYERLDKGLIKRIKEAGVKLYVLNRNGITVQM